LKALVEVLARVRHVVGHVVDDESRGHFALYVGIDVRPCERKECGQRQQGRQAGELPGALRLRRSGRLTGGGANVKPPGTERP
jgi:hypothetical protein